MTCLSFLSKLIQMLPSGALTVVRREIAWLLLYGVLAGILRAFCLGAGWLIRCQRYNSGVIGVI